MKVWALVMARWFAILFAVVWLFGAASAQETGEIKTEDGYVLNYRYFKRAEKSPTVIYLPGLGGRAAYNEQGGYSLAQPLNRAGFNFIGFDRFDAIPTDRASSIEESVKRIMKRSKSGNAYFPNSDGKESGIENIVRNEVATAIKFAEASPVHDNAGGIFLVGSSTGGLTALIAVRDFPRKIKGVVFLSPGTYPGWFETKIEGYDVPGYLNSLLAAYGKLPGLAIGGKHDAISSSSSNVKIRNQSALDAALYLQTRIGPSIEVMGLDTNLHGEKLLETNQEVRDKIVEWLSKHK